MFDLRQARARHFPEEQARFDRGDLVVRDMAGEGKLNFSAFHSPAFVRTRLLANLQVLEHRPGQTSQDLWIVRNAAPAVSDPRDIPRSKPAHQ
jgi:hypothetical protein